MVVVNRYYLFNSDGELHRIEKDGHYITVKEAVEHAIRSIDDIDGVEYSESWWIEFPVGHGKIKVYTKAQIINSGDYDDILPDV